jgi:glutamine synthetase
MTPRDFFAYAKKHKAEMVDLKFTDLLGTWQHCSFPIETWDAGTFKEGVGFDGSSIRGWQAINVSDMLAVPVASTACIDPFFREPTVSVIANIVDPITGEDYTRDPRHVARKAVEHLKKSRVADTCHVGPEAAAATFHQQPQESPVGQGVPEQPTLVRSWSLSRNQYFSRAARMASWGS